MKYHECKVGQIVSSTGNDWFYWRIIETDNIKKTVTLQVCKDLTGKYPETIDNIHICDNPPILRIVEDVHKIFTDEDFIL